MSIKRVLAAGCVLMAAGMANAHLLDGSLSVKGGETFTAGQVVPVKWNVNVLHDGKMDIDYSKDGGTTWTSVKANYPAVAGDNTFNWTVPSDATTKGKIRVCLGAGSPCSEAKTSSPNAAPYALISPAFTVSGATSVSAPAFAGEASLSFNGETRNVNVSFSLASEQDVSLQAFDAQGHLIATLLQGDRGAGYHQLSLYSNRLEAVHGVVVLKLQAGAETRTQSWNLAR
jgi:hypothetical protein